MDRIALRILEEELGKDAGALEEAAAQARRMLEESSAGHLPACGHELNRFYNILEKSFERVAEAFENHFDKRGDYHGRLIERMNLEIRDIRPAFLPDDLLGPVREIKGFRHVFRHAYDLRLDPERLRPVVGHAEALAGKFGGLSTRFIERIAEKL